MRISKVLCKEVTTVLLNDISYINFFSRVSHLSERERRGRNDERPWERISSFIAFHQNLASEKEICLQLIAHIWANLLRNVCRFLQFDSIFQLFLSTFVRGLPVLLSYFPLKSIFFNIISFWCCLTQNGQKWYGVMLAFGNNFKFWYSKKSHT